MTCTITAAFMEAKLASLAARVTGVFAASGVFDPE
jgi:hypothetical protein